MESIPNRILILQHIIQLRHLKFIMVVIRLARSGTKKNPFFHIVATDRRNPRDGRFIERLGYYHPLARGQSSRLVMEISRIQHWVKQGAEPSSRVSSLMKEYEHSQPNAQVSESTAPSSEIKTSSESQNSVHVEPDSSTPTDQ